jgi:PHD/YefM family antitoxin component YafN of YafNO toxin-antitoxin module
MKQVDSFKKVPTSRFRREMRKWMRYVEQKNEPVVITHRSHQSVVFVPIKYLEDLATNFS